MITVDNAVILAAGYASRFAPISNICPKALLPVKGEILLERQIRQLKEAGIRDIYIVTGFYAEAFSYLPDKLGVTLIHNPDYRERNNHSSIYAAKEVLANSYICCADNYFPENLFTPTAEAPYYSALFADGPTDEYCLTTDQTGRITEVTIGGCHSWHMLGHVFWDEAFTRTYLPLLEQEYHLPQTRNMYWETLYMNHLSKLTLYLKKYPADSILEFDSLEELALFDSFYQEKTPEEIISYLDTHLPF